MNDATHTFVQTKTEPTQPWAVQMLPIAFYLTMSSSLVVVVLLLSHFYKNKPHKASLGYDIIKMFVNTFIRINVKYQKPTGNQFSLLHKLN